jgi:phage tail sheath gpL-like
MRRNKEGTRVEERSEIVTPRCEGLIEKEIVDCHITCSKSILTLEEISR